ncbi:MAG TPA: polymorphic toxin-type HINT domain-containing protein [Pirellulales bacterium]|nr:polymorphic toxin-type HINT domain-containing protein [Pirellulales bacterium]
MKKLDHVRDVEWPIMFEMERFELMLNRIQLVLDVIGVLDPTGAADGINAVISLLRGNFLDAAVSALGAIFPYLGDIAKLGKFGKFADDGLEALRRVGGDFLTGVAARAGFESSCELAAKIGLDGKRLGKLLPIGCFVGGTDAGGLVRVAVGEPIIVQAQSPAEFEATGMDLRRLFACLMVTMAAGGWLVANRRLPKKDEKRCAIDALFNGGCEDGVVLDHESLDLLALGRRVSDAESTINCAHVEIMNRLAFDDSPKVAGILRMPSPLAGGPSIRGDVASHVERDAATAATVSRSAADSQIERKHAIGAARKVSQGRRTTDSFARRQSRFGIFWLVGCLAVAAFSFFSVPSRPAKPTSAVVASAAAAPGAPQWRYELRMKPIEDYRVGERFIAINPLGADDEPEPDPATWKSVKMQLRKPSGKYVSMTLLLSPEKMAAYGVDHRPRVEIELPEMGMSGEAEVLSVDPCPEIEPGEGSVVTGTFAHESEGNLLNVFFEECAEPLGVTDKHPFLSLDRGDFVSAGELRVGELLSRPEDGTAARVALLERRPADELVYNLQVNGHHVYHVGPLAVLVHNACAGLPTQYGIEGIYEFTAKNGKTYVGQSNDILRRLLEHIASKKLKKSDIVTIKYRPVSGGKLAREIAEQFRIQALGGIRGGFLDNKRNPVHILGPLFQ